MTPFAPPLEKPSMTRTFTACFSASASGTPWSPNCAPFTTSLRLVFVMSTEPMRTGVPGSTFGPMMSRMSGGSTRGATAIALSSHVVRSL